MCTRVASIAFQVCVFVRMPFVRMPFYTLFSFLLFAGDIGTLFLVDYAKEKHGQKMQDVHGKVCCLVALNVLVAGFVGKSKGGPSGGTIASVLNIIKVFD